MSITPKLIKTDLAEYEPAQWTGRNTSGIEPIAADSGTVLVLLDKVVEKSRGGIMLPQNLTERQGLAAESGVLVASDPKSDLAPYVGRRVYFERYAGATVIGADDQRYRLMSAASVAGVEVE